MGKIREVIIRLERKKAVFSSGDIINGSLSFKINERIKLNSLKLFIMGESEYFVSSKEHYSRTYGEKRVFEENVKDFIFIIPKDKYADTFSLNEGDYSYQFQMQLPDDLPNSLKHEKAETKYYLKVVFDLNWMLNKNFYKKITVINQNLYDQKILYPNDKITCVQTKTPRIPFPFVLAYGLPCLELPIFAFLTLSKRYFLAGEEISFDVKINNPSSKPVQKLTVNLVKQIKCFDGKKETQFEMVLDQKVNYKLIEPQKNLEWKDELKSPLTEPTDSASKIININYYVELEVYSGFLKPKLRVNIPIVLGLFATGYFKADLEKFFS
jgi:hypothetical protein